MCVATVLSLIDSRSAISCCRRPSTRRANTSTSRREAFALELGRRHPAHDEPPHPRDELVGVEGLDDEVVRAEQQSRDAVERLGANAGEEEHRQVVAPLVADLAADLVAGHVRQADLEHDEGYVSRANGGEGVGARAHFDRLEARPL